MIGGRPGTRTLDPLIKTSCSGVGRMVVGRLPSWILEPSATDLCEPDLHVFAKLFEDRLERGS